jgi:two-component system, cell cycle sensor histidine kinase and response regulator CckA
MVFTERIIAREVEPITILVVEDEAPVRLVMCHILRQAGYRVHAACDGIEGLQMLAKLSEVHLAITDLFMPGMDGVAFARQASLERPNLRFLYISGVSEKFPDRDSSIPLLVKPFTVGELLQTVDRRLICNLAAGC